jgi:hypothetical protein
MRLSHATPFIGREARSVGDNQMPVDGGDKCWVTGFVRRTTNHPKAESTATPTRTGRKRTRWAFIDPIVLGNPEPRLRST